MSARPSVLFVCVHNAGKSQTAAALMRHLAADQVDVHSAGTEPDNELSSGAVSALAESGVSIVGEFPKPIDATVLARVDRVIVLGSDAQVSPIEGMRGTIERWVIMAEARRDVDSAQRARLVRDEIRTHVEALAAAFGVTG